MSLDKGKAIESALAQIEKKFGKGSIMRLGERPHEVASPGPATENGDPRATRIHL